MNEAWDNKKQYEKRDPSKVKQHKNKGGFKKPAPAAQKKIVPVNLYVTECCGVLATKEPCARKEEDKAENKLSQVSLGSFRCSKCGKPAKVSRKRNTDEETITV